MKIKMFTMVLLSLFIFAGTSLGSTIKIYPVFDKTAIDNNADGVFDIYADSNWLMVYYRSGGDQYRAALEFNLTGVPADFASASLSLSWIGKGDTCPQVNVHGYSGDGVSQLNDFAVNNSIAGPYAPSNYDLMKDIDVTNFVRTLFNQSDYYAGFVLAGDAPYGEGAGVSTFGYYDTIPGGIAESFWPSLTLTYTPVPLPGSVLLVSTGLLGLVGWRRFRKG